MSKALRPAAIAAMALLVVACASSASNASSAPPTLPISDRSAVPTQFGCQGGVLAVDAHRAGAVLAEASFACASGPPIASGSPWPISAKQAANAFRSFVGLPNVAFEVTGPYQDGSRKLYSLSSNDPIGNPHYFAVGGSVDAATGDVVQVAYVSHIGGDPGPRLVDASVAQTKAADYLRHHLVDVSGLTMSSAATSSGWEFTWEQMRGDVGLPPRVTVTIDWQYADLVSFNRITDAVDAPNIPQAKLSRQQAEALALSSTWLGEPRVEASGLRYVDWGYAGPKLVWFVHISGKGDDPTKPTYFDLTFDAVTGEAL